MMRRKGKTAANQVPAGNKTTIQITPPPGSHIRVAATTSGISPSFTLPRHYPLQYLVQVGSLHEFTAWRGWRIKLMVVLEEDPECHYRSHRSRPTNTYSSFQYRNHRASNRIAGDIYQAVMAFLQRAARSFLRRPRPLHFFLP